MTDRPTIQDIRRFVDGELEPEAAGTIEQRLEHDDELRRVIEFERRLRDRVLKIMAGQAPSAPAGLDERIRAALAGAGYVESSDIAGRIAPRPSPRAHVTEKPSTIDRRSIFSGPTKANVFAVAASLLIVAGAILFGIFGPPIDHQGQLTVDHVADSGAFVAGEHMRCADSEESLKQKLRVTTRDGIASQMAQYLGVSGLPDFDLTPLHYTFVGGGPCQVPHARRSAHLMFRRDTPADDGRWPMVSVFMVPDEGQFNRSVPLAKWPGVWMDCQDQQMERDVLCASNGEVVFFICCCLSEELPELAEFLREAVQAP